MPSDAKAPLGGAGQVLAIPLVLFGVGGAAWYEYDMQMSWFAHHPASMLVAFVALGGNAALIKKKGGYANTKMHGNLLSLALGVALFGYYVIYANKEMNNKPHLTSWHAWLGFGALIGWIALALVGLLGLHPDFGAIKTNQQVRFVHKWGGRLATAAGWAACVLGFMKMDSDPMHQAAFAAPLALAGLFVLL